MDKHTHGAGFLIHKDTVNSVMRCDGVVSRRLINIRLKANPFNITITQAYAPTCDYNDKAVGDWNAKASDVYNDWKETFRRSCNSESSDRGPRLLALVIYNNPVTVNTICRHKASRRQTITIQMENTTARQTTSWSEGVPS